MAKVRLLLAVASGFAPAALLWCLTTAIPAFAVDLDFPPTDFVVRSSDGAHVIGHARFSITNEAGGESTVHGVYRYLNGESDIEDDTVRIDPGKPLPVMVRSRHAFFHADGAPDRESKADMRAGIGTCTIYQNSQAQVTSAQLDFPADTYAGAAVVIPLREYLKGGGSGTLHFHDFNCVPGPKVVKVSAAAQATAPWPYYPGSLMQLDVKPDFGWLNLVVAPFLPEMRAWFDPSDGWNFVGAQSARYYKGTKILMARAPQRETVIQADSAAGSGSTSKSPAESSPAAATKPGTVAGAGSAPDVPAEVVAPDPSAASGPK